VGYKTMVIGGYGTVGKAICQILARHDETQLVVAGRNAEKASQLANELGGEGRTCDVTDRDSLRTSFEDIDLVVNSFAGPFTGIPLDVPEVALECGVHYADVAGAFDYSDRLLDLSGRAQEKGLTFITGLGANPCLASLLITREASRLDSLDNAHIYFVIGTMAGDAFSTASLMEAALMQQQTTLAWNGAEWIPPQSSCE
jgi:saccharopine dehydrogenase (NAD+, L-lysine forming)